MSTMTDKQMWDKYRAERNPAMRDWYASKLKERGNNGSKAAKEYAALTHLGNKAGK